MKNVGKELLQSILADIILDQSIEKWVFKEIDNALMRYDKDYFLKLTTVLKEMEGK